MRRKAPPRYDNDEENIARWLRFMFASRSGRVLKHELMETAQVRGFRRMAVVGVLEEMRARRRVEAGLTVLYYPEWMAP